MILNYSFFHQLTTRNGPSGILMHVQQLWFNIVGLEHVWQENLDSESRAPEKVKIF